MALFRVVDPSPLVRLVLVSRLRAQHVRSRRASSLLEPSRASRRRRAQKNHARAHRVIARRPQRVVVHRAFARQQRSTERGESERVSASPPRALPRARARERPPRVR